ncbi:MAG: histidine--tRNA ligase [Actinomycetota bacterium]
MELDPPRGTTDLFPPESDAMLALYQDAHQLANRFGYRYLETPAFEHTELFARTSGEGSDVVTKEMYTFEDKGGRSLTLRPEGTAPVTRAYLERRQDLPTPFKAYYVAPMWRHGRPQAGRLREFRHFGIEVIGTDAPGADVEAMVVGDKFLRGRGLTKLKLFVNSVGDKECRPAYRELLVAFLRDHEDKLCKDSRARIDTNPLRVFDCKEETCRAVMRDAPLIPDHLCESCRDHFISVQAGLKFEGLAFEHDPRLVRGLDYYTRTAFEFVSEVLNPAQATVCGGGRYDGLAEELGGEPTPGIGFGLGLDRTLLALDEEGAGLPSARGAACFVVRIGDKAEQVARELLGDLRAAGVAASASFEDRPLKAQLKMANSSGARYAAIIGEKELAAKQVTLKRLSDGQQETVALSEAVKWITERA